METDWNPIILHHDISQHQCCEYDDYIGILLGFFKDYVYTMSINHDEMGTEGAGGEIEQDNTSQIKWLGQSMRLLGILIYTFGITF